MHFIILIYLYTYIEINLHENYLLLQTIKVHSAMNIYNILILFLIYLAVNKIINQCLLILVIGMYLI